MYQMKYPELAKVEEDNQEYLEIFVDGLRILFHTSPLMDKRGIGRVTRAILDEFIALQDVDRPDNHTIYFYSTIHWCPDRLPPNACILVHDVLPLVKPYLFPVESVEWADKYRKIAAQAKTILTISQSSADDIAQYLQVNRDDIRVIYNGIRKLPLPDVNFRASAKKVKDNSLQLVGKAVPLPESGYFCFLGAVDKHKNIRIIYDAMRENKALNLAIVGDIDLSSKSLLGYPDLADRVYLLGSLSDTEMSAVLKNSLGLVFPTIYEGFGLPPFEAGSIGVASICSDIPVIKELMEDACLYANIWDHNTWNEQMSRLMNDAVARKKYGELAEKRCDQFNWGDTVRRMLSEFK